MTCAITCHELGHSVSTDHVADANPREAVGGALAVKLRALDPASFAVPGRYGCRGFDDITAGC